MRDSYIKQNVDRFLNRWRKEEDAIFDTHREALVNFLERQAVIIPFPIYGNIQTDLPDGYKYEKVGDLFDRHLDEMINFYKKIEHSFNALDVPEELSPNASPFEPYWNNEYFTGADARALYGIASTFNPQRVLEIGVGHSTRFLRKAVDDNALRTQIISVDPSPRIDVAGVTDMHFANNIHDLDLNLIDELERDDILFLDGSHVSLPGTDVPHYSLNILPRVPRGVLVQIHDIFLPWEYNAEFRRRQYNEQHMIGIMLLFSDQWDILLPNYFLYRSGILPMSGCSLWLRRR